MPHIHDQSHSSLCATQPPGKLIDRYNRHLNYLRVSITDRCNLRCIYCSPDTTYKLKHAEILSYEELLRLVKIAIKLGVSKVRITGGEPLVRKGVCNFLARITALDGLADVSLTTNGTLLASHLESIHAAGVKRINISLDTLQRQKFARITGRDAFDQVWQGIMQAMEIGFTPIKVNVVAMAGVNDDELEAFARLSLHYPFHIRFIEHMPLSGAKASHHPGLLTPMIKNRLHRIGPMIAVAQTANDGPADRYRFEGGMGEVGFISAISQHFCSRCNRLRLTASGELRPCLLSDIQLDLKTPLRQNASDEELAEIFIRAIAHKPADHHLSDRHANEVRGCMSSIGG